MVAVHSYENKIVEDLKKLMKEFNYKTPQDAFVHWCLKLVSNVDDDDKISDSYTNGSNDLGIDGIMIIEGDPNTIFLIQSKIGGSIDRKEVREFVQSSIKVLKNPSFAATGNSNIIRLSRYARDILKSPNCNLVFCYLNLGKFTENAIFELNDAKKQYENEFKQVGSVQFLHFDKEGVIDTYKRNLDLFKIEPDVRLSIVNGEVFEKIKRININDEEIDQKSLVFTAKASEIGKLRNEQGRSLLLINVRYSVGATIVNKGINNTLIADKEKFWFYNNGIYATCKSFKVSDDKKSVEIKGMQIVNGCQTSTAFGQIISEGYDLENTDVLLRLVESKRSTFLDNISAYTNSQNAVKQRDLRSNDEIQSRLFKEFISLSFFDKKYFYQRKTGEFKHYKKEFESLTRGRDVIDNLKVAQAIMSFTLQRPSRAKAAGDKLFAENYGDIFIPNNDMNKIHSINVFFPWYVYDFIAKKIKNIISQEKIEDDDTSKKSHPHDYLEQALSTVVACIAYCFLKKYCSSSIDNLLKFFNEMNEETFKRYIDHYAKISIHVLDTVCKTLYSGKVPDENFDARRTFLSTSLFKEIIVPAIDDYVRGFSIQKIDALTPPK